MATVEECRVAIEELSSRLDGVDRDARRTHIPDRTIGLTLLDLDVTFLGRLHDGELVDVVLSPTPKPQVRLIMDSDDLIALTRGDLKFAHAWAGGRIRLDASLRDLLRLRRLLHS